MKLTFVSLVTIACLHAVLALPTVPTVYLERRGGGPDPIPRSKISPPLQSPPASSDNKGDLPPPEFIPERKPQPYQGPHDDQVGKRFSTKQGDPPPPQAIRQERKPSSENDSESDGDSDGPGKHTNPSNSRRVTGNDDYEPLTYWFPHNYWDDYMRDNYGILPRRKPSSENDSKSDGYSDGPVKHTSHDSTQNVNNPEVH